MNIDIDLNTATVSMKIFSDLFRSDGFRSNSCPFLSSFLYSVEYFCSAKYLSSSKQKEANIFMSILPAVSENEAPYSHL